MSPTCTHLDQIELTELPDAIPGREDCLASAHARTTDHPIARSAEPGEDWSWCYVDQVAFVIAGRAASEEAT
jgi:hypothetical protein